jgi:DNA primase catalytic core
MRNYIEDLKRVPIQDVANILGLKLTKTGNSLQGNCPTGHPSTNGRCFSVNTDQNYYHCFSCGKAGDVISLVELVNDHDFREAASWLGREFNISIPESIEDKGRHDEAFYSRAAMYEEIFQYGKYLLYQADGGEARQYLLQHRGFQSSEDIQNTEWIFLPPDDRLQAYLQGKYPDLSDKVSKIKFNSFVESPYWAAFPYRDRDGLITGFILRALSPKGYDLTFKSSGQKVTNARYHSTFGTSKHDLFNLNRCVNQQTLLILEGYPDAILFPTMGLKNVVAIGQGKLAKSHIEGLNEFGVHNVIILFDNDPPKENGYRTGIENTIDAVKMLLTETRINAFVIDPLLMGEHKDPDEYVRANGIEAYRLLMANAQSGAKWLARKIASKYDLQVDLERQKAIDEIGDLSSQIKNRIASEDFVNEAAKAMSINTEALEEHIRDYHERIQRAALSDKFKKLTMKAEDLRRAGDLEGARKLLETKGVEFKNELYKTKIQVVEPLSDRLIQKYELERNREAGLLGYPLTKFKNLCEHIDGVQPGLYLIGAETNVGKTALLTNIALDLIQSNTNIRVLYFSLDDSWSVITTRFLGILTGLELNQVQRKQASESNAMKVQDAYKELAHLVESGRLHIKDLSEVTNFDQAEAVVRELYEEGNLAVFIDGLYNLEVDNNGGGIRETNIERANKLKLLVDTYRIPLICTAELRKKTKEEGKDKPPTVSDLMETGKFGYNANVVWLLYPESTADSKHDDTIIVKLDYAKNKLLHYKDYQSLMFEKKKGIVSEIHIANESSVQDNRPLASW